MGGSSIIVGVGLLIVLLAGFVHLRRGRVRLMEYHHMPTRAVIHLSQAAPGAEPLAGPGSFSLAEA